MAFPESRPPPGSAPAAQQRVWEAVLLECGLLFILALLLEGLAFSLPVTLRSAGSIAVTLLPALVWLLNSWWRGGYRPRLRMAATGCFLIAALLCNAVCLPLINQVYDVQGWLPLESAINRIAGYSLTVGLTQALALWLVVRHAVPRRDLLESLDLLVCCRAAATGYVVVASLDHALRVGPTVSAQSSHVFNTLASLNCVAIMLSLALADLYFRRNLFLLRPALTTALAALIAGSAIPLVSGFSNAGIRALQPVSEASPLLGNFYSLAMLLSVWLVIRFLFAMTRGAMDVAQDGDGAP